MQNIVRELLSKRDLRHLAIIDALLQRKHTIKELSKKLNIQAKTISLDIKDINNYIMPIKIAISYEGVSLIMTKNTSSRYLYNQVLKQSREIFLIEEMFFRKKLSVPALSKKFFVSEMTLRRRINQINKKIKPMGIAIDTKRMQFSGGNNELIQLLTFVMSEKYYSTSFYLSEKELALLDALFKEVIPNIQLNFPDLEKMRLLVCLRMQLIRKGEAVYSNNIRPLTCSVELKEEIDSHFGIELSEKTLSYLFDQYINAGFSFDCQKMPRDETYDKQKEEFIDSLTQLVTEISQTFKICCSNQKELVEDIYNISNTNKKCMSTIYNRQKNFLDNLPVSLEPISIYLRNAIDNKFNQQLDKSRVDEITYVIMTHWQGLIRDISHSVGHILVGVFYDNDIEHTNFICHAVSSVSPVDVVSIIPEEINLEALVKTIAKLDLLVTNIPNIASENDKVICTEDFPSQQDLTNIRRKILEIYNKRIIEMIENTQTKMPDNEASFLLVNKRLISP